ncbi:MAG: hypothetical protein HQ523_01455 [Lentisphaerae bacterium]|nr:hypothetical protein [Lentisphaerota bacterium]
MRVETKIDPGICGFHATVAAATEDGQNVSFEFVTECETMREFARQVEAISPVDAYMALGPDENPMLAKARALLQTKGCCEACIVPAGAVKTMQVATNLALPKDVSIAISRT